LKQAQRIRRLDGFRRHDISTLLAGSSNIGVELGVAEGIFSQRMVESGKFAHFYGVDMYADRHDTAQYKRALSLIGLRSPYRLLRMRFDEAIDLFDDESLDFIYVDGYAHGGEDGGETLFRWYDKVKVGGLIAGDDYDPAWPLVQEAVDEFARQLDVELMLTEVTESDNPYGRYPTWAIRKLQARSVAVPEDLLRRGRSALRLAAMKDRDSLVRRAARALCPPILLEWAKQLRRE
jgi:Methyltransferase domain